MPVASCARKWLHTTPQTLSGQIKLLEDWLGRALFRKNGRQLELTEHGRLALGYADQIFSLGQDLETALRQTRSAQRRLDFRVGVADSLSKSIAYRLLEPAFAIGQPIKLLASKGTFDELMPRRLLGGFERAIPSAGRSKERCTVVAAGSRVVQQCLDRGIHARRIRTSQYDSLIILLNLALQATGGNR